VFYDLQTIHNQLVSYFNFRRFCVYILVYILAFGIANIDICFEIQNNYTLFQFQKNKILTERLSTNCIFTLHFFKKETKNNLFTCIYIEKQMKNNNYSFKIEKNLPLTSFRKIPIVKFQT